MSLGGKILKSKDLIFKYYLLEEGFCYGSFAVDDYLKAVTLKVIADTVVIVAAI